MREKLFFLVAISLVSAACAGGNVASKLATAPQYQPKGGDSKCGVTKSQAKPLIVEWSPSDRGQLESRVHRGLVAVHYEGCEMEVLERCHLAGSYTYQGITPKHDSVVMHDADDLYANVPLGAAKLESTLNRAGSLKVTMTIVGRYDADVDEIKASDLKGDCARATHIVTALTTGAFDFYAEGEAKVGGGFGTAVGNAGVHGGSESKREMITDDGNEESCKKATGADKSPPEGCGALIRIEVAVIGAAKPVESACPEGSKWDDARCMRTNVVTEVQCPGGTKWDGARCIPNASIVAAAVAPAAPTPAPSATESGAMARIPGGTFQMGSPDGVGGADEHPRHSVAVAAFDMDVTEVTTGAYSVRPRGELQRGSHQPPVQL